MSANIFNFCCKKDSKVSEVDKPKMDPVNGHFVVPAPVCPFSGESEMKTDKTVKPNLKIKVPKPIQLKNHQSQDEAFDTLHNVEGISFNPTRCTEKVCQSSSMDIPSRSSTPLTPEKIYREAQSFLKEYFASVGRNNTQAYKARLEEIKAELLETGTYNLKIPELKFGAKVAWRNASRCIGRIQWKKLEIFPCFEVRTAKGMFDALCYHIRYSTNKGNIRSAITIFPPRTDGQHDYRIWNPQLISYAGYVQPDGSILGDPGRVEFTDICIKLGWKSPRTAWDILPMVLSADGKEPEYFEIPRDIVMEVEMEHPEYAWFKDMNLRWYALPAVSNMKLDCGGLEFTATAFNGWYMGTEIGCRNLCDSSRLNITEAVAKRMGLDTSSQTLWKDKALVEVNVAVLHSFQRDSVSIVNHHAASEQFIKHMNEETRVRGGCPSDWIWIVPPMSSSLTSVFHQELALYYLRPSYEYQEPAWKSYQWIKPEGNKPRRKFHFRQIARAVKVTAKMYGNALSKRIKATILYASETGKSEQYAKELGAIFSHAFHAQVYSMSDYETHSLEHETLLIIVTSTFGNGEPPANGVDFLDHLCSMLQDERKRGDHSSEAYTANIKSATPKSLIRSNSIVSPKNPLKRQLTRMESNRSYTSNTDTTESMRPLGNVHYAVFALGSSAYPRFCNFGKYVDSILSELGAVNIHPVVCGDELYGQEQQFKGWSSDIFHIACETLSIDDNEMVKNAKKAFGQIPLTEKTVRFRKTNENPTPMKTALEFSFRKQLISCSVKENKWLGYHDSTKATIFLNMELKNDLKYEPGDHVCVMPCNRKEIVDVVLERLQGVDDFDKSIQLQVIKEVLTPTDILKKWEPHERIPTVSLRDIFTRFLDITTPPSSTVLKYLADTCTDENDAQKFNDLLEDSNKYNDWQHFHYPNLAEVLEQYPSCKPQASLLVALLPKLQPRFYSLSSSPLAHPKEIHLTVAVVVYKTQSGKTRYGVSSNYLLNQKPGDEVLVFIRRAPNFHLPKDLNVPLILVGPGSGIAPFRGFWHHRRHQIMNITDNKKGVGDVWLFFGCQNKAMDLYKEEKEQAHKDNVLTNNLLALSREIGLEKKHVQSLIIEKGEEITKFLMEENGHFYICGDCKMADDVQQTLKNVLKKYACLSDSEVDSFVLDLMEQNRYHEDIFGITLRTGEVQSASRQFAKTRHESEKNYQKTQEIS